MLSYPQVTNLCEVRGSDRRLMLNGFSYDDCPAVGIHDLIFTAAQLCWHSPVGLWVCRVDCRLGVRHRPELRPVEGYMVL